jgi:hypothetical protein
MSGRQTCASWSQPSENWRGQRRPVTGPQVTCQLDYYWDNIQNEKETLPSQYGASNHSSHCIKNVDQW